MGCGVHNHVQIRQATCVRSSRSAGSRRSQRLHPHAGASRAAGRRRQARGDSPVARKGRSRLTLPPVQRDLAIPIHRDSG
eukprot:6506-Prymnesium_polylepis.1